MNFEIITYRWGEDLVGGAELHHRRLAGELADAGHDVRILTSNGGAIRPFCHWGIEWETGAGGDAGERFPVERHPIRRLPRWAMALMAKTVQRRIEAEAPAYIHGLGSDYTDALGPGPAVHLLSGWHHHERQGAEVRRWTSPRAFIAAALPGGVEGRLFIGGDLPKPNTLRALAGEKVLYEGRFRAGNALAEVPLPAGFRGIVELRFARGWRPLRDFRSLALYANAVVLQTPDGTNHAADLFADHRSLGRTLGGKWEEELLRRAEERPLLYSHLIDLLRGPVCPGLSGRKGSGGRALRIFCNMPWATVGGAGAEDLVMALWHIDDDFYAWRHWVGRLRQCRFVLANSPYTANDFFPRHGIRAHFVGPPIWEPPPGRNAGRVEALRRELALGEDEAVVLTICRKSPEKRYDMIARAVEILRSKGVKARFVGIGPDADERPLDHDGAVWLGRRPWEDLQTAYELCDVFVLFSESESFGMVIPEAWHHGRPVIVNRHCRPAASLVEEGKDGLLAGSVEELAAALEGLLANEPRRRDMGAKGQEKARKHYTKGAAAARLLKALEEEGMLDGEG